jgi:hypothetical protein
MGLHVFQIADNLAIAGANGGNVNFGMGLGCVETPRERRHKFVEVGEAL